MKENLFSTGNIRLFSGRYVNPLLMRPEDIDLIDIAHGLTHRCRFAGHTQGFYSVAEHSLRVAQLVPGHLRLQALLHDASEAYLFDIPSPLKTYFPALVELENQLMRIIATRFGFGWPVDEIVKQADRQALHEEWNQQVLNRPTYRNDLETIEEVFFFEVKNELDRIDTLKSLTIHD